MTRPVTIELTEWLPDQADLNATGMTVVKNALPGVKGYEPFPGLSPQTTSTTSTTANSLFAAFDGSGNETIFVGDTSNIYQFTGGTLTNLSGTVYGTTSGDRWRFTLYGDRVVATNNADPVQYYDLSSSSAFGSLAGSPPVAKFVATVRDFVWLGNISGTPYRVQWSGLGNSETWSSSQTTQADFQDLFSGGEVRGLVGGEYAVILCEHSIYRAAYVGAPIIFQVDEVENSRGCLVPGSVVGIGQDVYYWADNGVWKFNGQQAMPIGEQRVDKWLLDEFDKEYLDNVWAAKNSDKNLVMWLFCGPSSGGTPNRLLCYNYVLDRFTYCEVSANVIGEILTSGTTLDSIDEFIDDVDEFVDSSAYTGGLRIAAAVDTSGFVSYFTGNALSARFETNEFQAQSGDRTVITEVWPLVDGGTLSANVAAKARQNDTITFGSTAIQNSVGFCPFRSEGRFHKVALNVSGNDWDHATGMLIEVGSAGGR